MTARRRKQAAPGSGGAPRGAPYAALAMGVLAVGAYLCLVNLDYAALWHDEASAALIGRNLLQRGDISGWDGRNLVGGTNGRTLNDQLRDVLPPLTYVINAAGMAVFGINETGARSMPALLGIATLGLLYLLLRQHVPEHPRLILWCLLFAAWSTATAAVLSSIALLRVPGVRADRRVLPLRALVAQPQGQVSGRGDAGGGAGVLQPLRRRCGDHAGAGRLAPAVPRPRHGTAAVAGVGRQRARGGGAGHGVSRLAGGARG